MFNKIKHNFGLFLLLGLLTPLILVNFGTARAEDFVDTAFKAQWQATDQAVSTGAAQHTYFWGPAAFAHTKEVYAESPNGQREVQYFDKARMELSHTAATANNVTNGLLTEELVTGQLQVGDSQFLQRTPATNPVAGDQVNNPDAPTYASFNKGKLAFGVAGTVKAAPRKGQDVAERVDPDGNVTSNPGPVSVKYGDYYEQTGHNLADVFANFFQQSPLGDTKWLAVMGYPISEPYWTKAQINVGGQPHDVLIQLFQRRVLTYTPANPTAFQVEMGNIGQHYYVWRYGFDPRDQLPGNYRVVTPQDTSLLSIKLDGTQTVVGKTSDPITGSWAFGEGRAVVATDNGVYLADLTKNRFKQLDLPNVVKGTSVSSVSQAAGDPSRLAISFLGLQQNATIIGIFQLGTLDSGDNLQVKDSIFLSGVENPTSTEVSFSYSGKFLLIDQQVVYSLADQKTLDIGTIVNITDPDYLYSIEWVGHTDKLITTVNAAGLFADGATTTGTVSLIDASTGSSIKLLEDANIYQALPSPDGNYLALLFFKTNQSTDLSSLMITSRLHFASLNNPTVPVTGDYEQSTMGLVRAEPFLQGWNADGTYVALSSLNSGVAGGSTNNINFISLANGAAIFKTSLPNVFPSYNLLKLAGPFYILHAIHESNEFAPATKQTITIQNLDGSNQKDVLSLNVPTHAPANRETTITNAQLVQVP